MVTFRLFLVLSFFLGMPLVVNAATDASIVAKVGGVPVTAYELDRQIDRVLPLRVSFHGGITAEKKAEIVEEALSDLIERGLKVQYAIDNEISVSAKIIDEQIEKVKERFKTEKEFKQAVGDETIDGLRASLYRQFLAEEAEKIVIDSESGASEKEIEEYYEKYKHTFFMPKQFRASHILVKVDPSSNKEERAAFKEEAEKLLERAKNGEDFFDLAYYNSDDRSKYVGGDLGMFHEGQTEKSFEEALLKLKVGEISDLVWTRFGYHIIKLTQVNEPRQMSFDEVKLKIKTRLETERREKLYKKWIEELEGKYKVERFVQ